MSDAPLSMADALAHLDEQPDETQAAAAAPADTPAAASADEEIDPAGQPGEGEGEPEEANPDAETDEDKEAAEPEDKPSAIEPPTFWSADAKARFGELPPDLQQVVLDQAKAGDTRVSTALQEVADRRKAVDTEFQNVTQVAQALKDWLPQAVQTFQSRWANVDWQAWAKQDPAACLEGKLQFEAEQQQLEQVKTANQRAQAAALQRTVEAEREKLSTLVPDLVDPKTGPNLRQSMTTYALGKGLTQEQIDDLPAVAVSIIHDAFRWADAQARLKASTAPRQAPPKVTRPSAGVGQGSSQQRASAAAKAQFDKDPSLANALARMNSL